MTWQSPGSPNSAAPPSAASCLGELSPGSGSFVFPTPAYPPCRESGPDLGGVQSYHPGSTSAHGASSARLYGFLQLQLSSLLSHCISLPLPSSLQTCPLLVLFCVEIFPQHSPLREQLSTPVLSLSIWVAPSCVLCEPAHLRTVPSASVMFLAVPCTLGFWALLVFALFATAFHPGHWQCVSKRGDLWTPRGPALLLAGTEAGDLKPGGAAESEPGRPRGVSGCSGGNADA